MCANLAVLTRLSRIAGEAASEAARAAAARALIDTCTQRICDRLGIVATRRPTMCAKEDAKDALDALRAMVFKTELAADGGTAPIFAAARQRIEMARRALDLRIVDDASARADIRAAGRSCDTAHDRDAIRAMRHRLRDRDAIITSREAIRQSRALLARLAAPPSR